MMLGDGIDHPWMTMHFGLQRRLVLCEPFAAVMHPVATHTMTDVFGESTKSLRQFHFRRGCAKDCLEPVWMDAGTSQPINGSVDVVKQIMENGFDQLISRRAEQTWQKRPVSIPLAAEQPLACAKSVGTP